MTKLLMNYLSATAGHPPILPASFPASFTGLRAFVANSTIIFTANDENTRRPENEAGLRYILIPKFSKKKTCPDS